MTHQKRIENRKRRYNRLLKLKNNYLTNHKILHEKRNILYLFLFITIPLVTFLVFQSSILSILIFSLLFVVYIAKISGRRLYQYVHQQTNPYHLILEEQRINPELLLVDPKLKIYGKMLPLKKEKQKIHLLLDRSKISLPSFFQLTFKDDILLIAAYMHLLNVNFFVPVSAMVGEIKYKNRKNTKKITFKNSNSLNNHVKMLLKQFKSTSSQRLKAFPFRCVRCPYKQSCEQVQYFPKLVASKTNTEDVDETYKELNQVTDQLISTNFTNWRKNIRELLNVFHRSHFIQKRLLQINRRAGEYDIKQIIESAIFHNVRIANDYLSSDSGLAFSYQLLLYLEQHGKKEILEKIIKFYGLNEGKDNKTSNDIKLNNFIKLITRNLIMALDQYLFPHVSPNIPRIEYNNYGGVMNISYDQSIINTQATLIEED